MSSALVLRQSVVIDFLVNFFIAINALFRRGGDALR